MEDGNGDSSMTEGLVEGKDVGDARSVFQGIFSKSTPFSQPVLSTPVDSDFYNMKHPSRGKCIIFNNKSFEKHTRLNERRGTDIDAQQLYHRFRELDFDVILHKDKGTKSMLYELEELAKEDYSQSDCFVCCILTHGDKEVLYGTDGKFPTEYVFAPFRGDVCPTLLGKPKIFFIQACRGDRLDEGAHIVCDTTDAPSQVFKIPTHADFLVCYSTVPGFYSWRNTTQGSWFIQALCKTLQERARQMDLLSMMTVVCRKVAYEFESCVPNDAFMDKKKQIPCITSTLTRQIIFTPKI